jgi:hypothetical protein
VLEVTTGKRYDRFSNCNTYMQVKGRLEKLTKVSVKAPYSAADLL